MFRYSLCFKSWFQNSVTFDMMWWFIGEKWVGKFYVSSFQQGFLSGIKNMLHCTAVIIGFNFWWFPPFSQVCSCCWIESGKNKEVMLMQKRILKRDFSEGNLRVCIMTGQESFKKWKEHFTQSHFLKLQLGGKRLSTLFENRSH